MIEIVVLIPPINLLVHRHPVKSSNISCPVLMVYYFHVHLRCTWICKDQALVQNCICRILSLQGPLLDAQSDPIINESQKHVLCQRFEASIFACVIPMVHQSLQLTMHLPFNHCPSSAQVRVSLHGFFHSRGKRRRGVAWDGRREGGKGRG